jgi:Xaa-Pro aminopeptidase
VQLHESIGTVIAEGEQRLRPGANTRAVMDHCTQVLGKLGLRADLTTLVFHSIGLDILEYGHPSEKYGGWTIEPDMTMNFEVFHRDPDLGGVHMEDTVLVTPGGLEHFSTLPRRIMSCGQA